MQSRNAWPHTETMLCRADVLADYENPTVQFDSTYPDQLRQGRAQGIRRNIMPHRKRSPRVTAEMAARIKRLLLERMMQHDIAAKFGINPGRVSEIKTGRRFGNIAPTVEF